MHYIYASKIGRAVRAWQLTLRKRFRLCALFCDFVHKRVNMVSEDLWRQVYDFAWLVLEDLSNYDKAGAWPLILDDFVDAVREQRRSRFPTPPGPPSGMPFPYRPTDEVATLEAQMSGDGDREPSFLEISPCSPPTGSKRRMREPPEQAACEAGPAALGRAFTGHAARPWGRDIGPTPPGPRTSEGAGSMGRRRVSPAVRGVAMEGMEDGAEGGESPDADGVGGRGSEDSAGGMSTGGIVGGLAKRLRLADLSPSVSFGRGLNVEG